MRKVIFKQCIGIVLLLCFRGGALLHAHTIKKIETTHFSLGFDASITDTAQRIANTLEAIYLPVSKTLGGYPSPIRVWFNTQLTCSNGSFCIAPRHIKLYTYYSANPYFLGNLDWISFLCLHEFRHAVQYNVQYHAIPWLLKPVYVLGNMIPYVGIPRFFHEGDAVGIETALSKSGRGRLPGWDVWYRIHLLESKKTATFEQYLFHSDKYRLPDYYCLGYYLTTYIRRQYGAEAMQKIYRKSIRGLPFFGFYNTIRSVTKKSLLKIYKEMTQELFLGWKKQLEGLFITPVTQFTVKKSTVNVDYINPFVDKSGNLLAWKSGSDIRNQLVLLRPCAVARDMESRNATATFQEKRLCYCLASQLSAPAFAVEEGCAAWLEPYKHPWGHGGTLEDASESVQDSRMRLQYYDCTAKKIKTVVKNCTYNALAIAPNKCQLVAVEPDSNGRHHLVVLNIKDGKVIKKISHPDGGYYLTPSWCGTTYIVVATIKDQQNAIIRVEVATGTIETLLPNSYEHRNSPKIYKDYLLYNSSYSGIDNIYAMHLPTKTCFQVTSRKYGAYLGMVDPLSNQLIFSDCSKEGMEIVAMPFDPLLWIPLEKVKDRSLHYYAPLVTQEGNSEPLSKVPHCRYPVRSYCFATDSLSITGMQADGKVRTVPFELVNVQENFKITPYLYYNIFDSRLVINVLSRMGMGANKKPKDGTKIAALGMTLQYKTCYPLFHLDAGLEWYKGSSELDGRRLELDIKLPHYFSLDTSSASLTVGTTAIIRPLQGKVKKEKRITYPIDLSLDYYCILKHDSTRSQKDIHHPPWSQKLSATFSHRLTAPVIYSYETLWTIEGEVYFPGIGMHHYCGIEARWSLGKTPYQSFLFRGNKCTTRSRCNELQGNLKYGFPLCYPECGLPLLVFIKRLDGEMYLSFQRIDQTRPAKMNPLKSKSLLWWKIPQAGVKLKISHQLFSIEDREPKPHIQLDFFIKGDECFWDITTWKLGYGINVSLF